MKAFTNFILKKPVLMVNSGFLLPVLAIHLQPSNRTNEHATVVLISVPFSISSLSFPLRVVSQDQFLNILQSEQVQKNNMK